MHLKVLLYPKKPSFSFLSRLYLTIKCRRFSFPKFISRAIPMMSSSFPLMRRWTCISTGFFRIRWSTRIPSPSPSAALTAFWPWCTPSRIYLFLQVCQTLQYGSIQLMLLFLGFNQASHGGCNLRRCPLESLSIRLYVLISITNIFFHGIFCSLVRILSIIPIMVSHDWITSCFTTLFFLGYCFWELSIILQMC